MSDNIGVAEIHAWAQELDEIRELIGDQFARTEPRNNAIGYIQGLLLDEEHKNSWTLSERAGQVTPDGCNGCYRPWIGTRTPCSGGLTGDDNTNIGPDYATTKSEAIPCNRKCSTRGQEERER